MTVHDLICATNMCDLTESYYDLLGSYANKLYDYDISKPVKFNLPKKPSNKQTEEKKMKEVYIKEIKIIVPNKVIEVLFSDGLKEKMVCHEEDTFDLRNCLFIAIAKHLYKSEYTLDGIEYKANELKYMKKYVKIVDYALKAYKKREEDIAKAKKEEDELNAFIARKKVKSAKRKEKRLAKQSAKRIAEMKEAYVLAMKECGHMCKECETSWDDLK